jgi:hypothetical protein
MLATEAHDLDVIVIQSHLLAGKQPPALGAGTEALNEWLHAPEPDEDLDVGAWLHEASALPDEDESDTIERRRREAMNG